ncbi:MAG: DNA polymerase III subunit gamma/tau [Myxococcota bacterium]|nr:DNA polymerase III subunit gamma/tau [Myxococcota bacterium]
MAYVALARKYRPATFASVVGQESIVQTIENAIKFDRVHHAYLFTGARGVGKTTTARLLAAALNQSEGPKSEIDVDDSITQAVAGGHCPDVLEIDGASNTGVDNIRELRENVRYLPSQARFKIYIIDEVHMLSTAAFNALLKTLEEPPPHVKFIFATTEPEKIPITILSRCQRFDFRKVSAPKLLGHLRYVLEKEDLTVEEDVIRVVAREAQGSVRDSLSILDQVLNLVSDGASHDEIFRSMGVVQQETILCLIRSILKKDADALLASCADIDERGYDFTHVTELLLAYFRDLLIVLKCEHPQEVVKERSPSELADMKELLRDVDAAILHRFFDSLSRSYSMITHGDLGRVQFEMALLKLLEFEGAKSVQTLINTLEKYLKDSAGMERSEGGKVEGDVVHPSAGTISPNEKETIQPPPQEASVAPPMVPFLKKPIEAISSPSAQASSVECISKEFSQEASLESAPEAVVDLETWGNIIKHVQKQSPMTGSLLEHARLLALSGEGIKLAYSEQDSFFMDSVKKPEARCLVDGILEAHFGHRVSLEFSLIPAEKFGAEGSVSLAEARASAEHARSEKIEEESIAHPAVQEALSLFGGEIKEVVVFDEQPN